MANILLFSLSTLIITSQNILQEEGKDKLYTEVFYKNGSSIKVCISYASEKQKLSASKNGKTGTAHLFPQGR